MSIFPLGNKLTSFSCHHLFSNSLLKLPKLFLSFLLLLSLMLQNLLGKEVLHHLVLEDRTLGHLVKSLYIFVQVARLLLNDFKLRVLVLETDLHTMQLCLQLLIFISKFDKLFTWFLFTHHINMN